MNARTRSAGDLALIWVSWAVMIAYLIFSAVLFNIGTESYILDGVMPVAVFWSMFCAVVGFGFNCAAIFVKGAWPNLISAILYAVAWFIGFPAGLSVAAFLFILIPCVLSFIAYFHILATSDRDEYELGEGYGDDEE